MKPLYSIEAPDQQRLKRARLEIEAVLRKNDLAGVVVLHTPGMAEFFYDIRPSYSCCWIDESVPMLRLKSKLSDYGGDADARLHDRVATANMAQALASDLARAARMFRDVASVLNQALGAEHGEPEFVHDPQQLKPQ